MYQRCTLVNNPPGHVTSVLLGVQFRMLWILVLSLGLLACNSTTALSELGTSGGRVGATVAVGTGGTFGDAGKTASEKLVAKMIASNGIDDNCALLNDGTVRCWGRNDTGQLGDGTTTNSSVPVIASGITNAVAVAAGDSHTCALLADGTVQCWGGTEGSVPVTISGISTAITVSAGGSDTCVVLSDATVQCWGSNEAGELGNGTTTYTYSSGPVTVSGISTASAVVGGGQHVCALLSGGTVQCWGYNGFGELGNGTTTYSSLPVTVSSITNATAVSGGGHDSCAVLSGGTIQCWGNNDSGALAETATSSDVPVTISGITNAVAVTTNQIDTCALLNDGTIRCWGFNGYGELGNGTTAVISQVISANFYMQNVVTVPVTVTGITNAVAIDVGCALLANGTVQCWGDNRYGQLGNGTTTNSSVPVTVIEN